MFRVNQNIRLESRKTSKLHKLREESGAFYVNVGPQHKAPLFACLLHFLSNGPSKKMVVVSENLEGKLWKTASF